MLDRGLHHVRAKHDRPHQGASQSTHAVLSHGRVGQGWALRRRNGKCEIQRPHRKNHPSKVGIQAKEHLREEHWKPSIVDRRRYEIFEKSDKKGMLDFAKDKAKRILEEHKPLPLPEHAQKRIDAIVEKAQNQ